MCTVLHGFPLYILVLQPSDSVMEIKSKQVNAILVTKKGTCSIYNCVQQSLPLNYSVFKAQPHHVLMQFCNENKKGGGWSWPIHQTTSSFSHISKN